MSLPYFAFYAGDYLRDTQHLTDRQHGVYLLLLLFQFNKGAAPTSPALLKQVTRCDDGEVIESVLAEFFDLTEDGWVNERMSEEIRKATETHKKRAQAGRKGGKAKLKPGLSREQAGLKPGLSNQNQNQNHNQSTKEVIETIDIRQPDGGRARLPEPSATKYSAEFLAWWDVYPKKAGKGAAFKAWKVAKKQASPEDLTRAAKAYAESEIVGDGFAKNPATWLNQGCWEDDPEAWKRAERRGTNGHTQRVEDLYPDLSRRGVTSGHGGGIA